eukprot:NODE_6322_length_583_cov_28.282772_g5911_i0.p1 GENE.NODE_6322_length_583_cov_28.282772_g5911_i0~~NODE_6322_length_583_cov_28.282772_g5911_i0.p1  ORF type:complete len:157 (-),score=19.61 NODE_6322_length_583_cov_28.282772_g5911_i0:55-525(-)
MRGGKNCPAERSASKPVSRFRKSLKSKERLSIDPRFSGTSGSFCHSLFKEEYGWLSDRRSAEIEKIENDLKSHKAPGKKRQALLKKLSLTKAQQRKEAELDQKHSPQASKGFFRSKAEDKKQNLLTKFEELKSKNKLDDWLRKKRKRNVLKDQGVL